MQRLAKTIAAPVQNFTQREFAARARGRAVQASAKTGGAKLPEGAEHRGGAAATGEPVVHEQDGARQGQRNRTAVLPGFAAEEQEGERGDLPSQKQGRNVEEYEPQRSEFQMHGH